MKKCAGLAVLFCLFTLFSAGCGMAVVPEGIDRPTVSVSQKGPISAWLVEDFAEDYYSLSELTEMAVKEAAEFNATVQGGRAAVAVDKVELLEDDDRKVRVNYRFDSWESYTKFNGESLFFGTMEEAVAEGFSSNVILKGVADNVLYAGEQMRQNTDKYVIITDVKANIYCPRQVTHLSDGLVVSEDGSVDTSGAEGTVYILMR